MTRFLFVCAVTLLAGWLIALGFAQTNLDPILIAKGWTAFDRGAFFLASLFSPLVGMVLLMIAVIRGDG